jgi:putative PIN family toxin of toxin-antitoxin system
VSAVLLSKSIPRQAVDLAAHVGRILLSEATLVELDEVLRRPKFDKYTSKELRLEFLVGLVRQAEVVDVLQHVAHCQDPNDDKFLDLACAGLASDLVTGDRHLLEIRVFQSVEIFTPTAFLTKWAGTPPKAETGG